MFAALLLTLVVGCEKKKNEPTGAGRTGGDPGGGGAATAKPDVRPPVPEDLAEYTKDLPGNGDTLIARIETPLGVVHCELFADKAPMTVASFVGLATGKKPWLGPNGVEKGKPFFDGLIFHRVIPGFMIQGGDPTGSGRGGPGYKFGDEHARDVEMGPGALAMANAGPGTNGSQFFIMDKDGSRPDLVGRHTIFGQCKEIEVVNKIATVPTGPGDRPNEPVTMQITISRG
jgi:peptidyl-prolyl cis-trans isomerase A (cyclophilin A)